MAATLDGLVDPGGAVFEAKFMLPWTFSEEAAAEKHMAQLQHNMWVANARSAVLSIITGGGQMGGDDGPCRSAVPAPAADGREEVLALRDERGGAAAVRGRAAASAAGSGPDRRYERLQLMGGVRSHLPPHPPGLPGARGRQGRPEEAGAGRCQGGHRARPARQALQIRRRQL